MIQKSVNLYFGKYILEIGIGQNLAVLGAEWEQNGKQNHPKSRRGLQSCTCTRETWYSVHALHMHADIIIVQSDVERGKCRSAIKGSTAYGMMVKAAAGAKPEAARHVQFKNYPR